MITIDPILWALLVGSVIPILVAVATKLSASGGVKAVIAAGLSLISGVVIALDNQGGGSFSWRILAITGATTLLTAVSTYVGVWAPIVKVNEVAAPNFGIGPAVVEPVEVG